MTNSVGKMLVNLRIHSVTFMRLILTEPIFLSTNITYAEKIVSKLSSFQRKMKLYLQN